MVETWQPVKSFPDYEVSNLGHFREKATGKAVKVYKGWYVHLMRHGILYARSAAKLVAQVYVPNPDPKNRKRVNQYNGKITDIRAENLYWANTWERQCPEAENRIKNAQQRIIDKKYAVIGTSLEDGHEVRFESCQAAGKAGFNFRCVSRCCRGEGHTHLGYTWRKADDDKNSGQRQSHGV
nr:MAG TPA: PROTEIN/DNA Complex catalytic motif, Helix-turn-helix DNA [Bacteriophage sp.]